MESRSPPVISTQLDYTPQCADPAGSGASLASSLFLMIINAEKAAAIATRPAAGATPPPHHRRGGDVRSFGPDGAPAGRPFENVIRERHELSEDRAR